MFENYSHQERIDLAKERIKRVVDHLLYQIEIHANNAHIVYQPTVASKIPRSYAANAFQIVQNAMHMFEFVRICTLWENVDLQKECIPTVVELIDDDAIIELLAEETRKNTDGKGAGFVNVSPNRFDAETEHKMAAEIDRMFAVQQAQRARDGLRDAIKKARAIMASDKLKSVMNHRDKHLAHNLIETHREKGGPVTPAKNGYETELLKESIPIVDAFYVWVNGVSFAWEPSQQFAEENAQSLWTSSRFEIYE